MKVKCGVVSQKGLRGRVNQDALLLKYGEIGKTEVLLGVICDGMGGLSKGEKASGDCIRRMELWFHEELPDLLEKQNMAENNSYKVEILLSAIQLHWQKLAEEMNLRLSGYGRLHDLTLGTTMLALLIVEGHYLLMHIGDCRCYERRMVWDGEAGERPELVLLTRDQTYLRSCVEKGIMTPKEAAADPRKHVLSQCIGASINLKPEFCTGVMEGKCDFLLCTDGFWKKMNRSHLVSIFDNCLRTREKALDKRLLSFVEFCREQGEKDDASALLISIKGRKSYETGRNLGWKVQSAKGNRSGRYEQGLPGGA